MVEYQVGRKNRIKNGRKKIRKVANEIRQTANTEKSQ